MGSPIKRELKILKKYAKGSKFILETGSGSSTNMFYKISVKNKSLFYSIDPCVDSVKGVPIDVVLKGWSVTYEDLIKPGDGSFYKSRYKNFPDGDVVFHGEEKMVGEKDLIRKTIFKVGFPPDFFFCDTGEYCGLAEWNVISPLLQKNSIFAAHDIYYPKSIKCFQVLRKIERSDDWSILVKTKSKQGLMVVKKVN